MNNPVLETERLPRFSEIRPEHIEPAIDELLNESRTTLQALLDDNDEYTWDNLVAPLERLEDRLNNAWSPIQHMNSVVNNEALREAYNACLPKLSGFQTELGQNRRLYEAFQSVRDRADFADLDRPRQRAIEQALRDFRLAGVVLPDEQKRRFADIVLRLSRLSSTFSENVLDATNTWRLDITDEEALSGLPESTLGLLAQASGEPNTWRLTLDAPIVMAVLAHADDRELRRTVYEAFTTLASELGHDDGRFDNLPVMEEILALRHEQAGLLGYANYAQLSLEPKMAESVPQVLEFLQDLARRSRPAAVQEFEALQIFAREEHGVETLEAWDIGYYTEKMRQARYSVSAEDLRPYFPVDRVIDGLFDVVGRLYGIRITSRDDVDTWHPDVRFYEIRDTDDALRAQFYMDLYARANKRGGAWMDVCRARHRTADELQLPVAYLTCNFTPPVGDDAALLTHSEVTTLFHEFGHGLHHMLTRVDTPSVAGISGVAWDAVELPSQFMENWTWERDALNLFAVHHESGEPLPDTLFERMMAARNFQSALQLVRQVEASLFDLHMHADYDPDRGARIYEVLEAVRDRVAVIRPPEFNRFPNSFAHVFAGGYAAGYYSYKWAEVLSADAFSRFEEEGIFNPATGRAFLENILERGGSEDAMTLFKGFRGREPSIEPLLKHAGLAA